jgi:hypothetical protein
LTLTDAFMQSNVYSSGSTPQATWINQIASAGYVAGAVSLLQQDLDYDCPSFLTKNGLFVDITGNYWLGAHINIDAASDKTAGLVFGIHGTNDVGIDFALDSATSYASRVFQYVTGSNTIHQVNINQIVAVDEPCGTGSASGTTFTGKVWQLNAGTTEKYSVDYRGIVPTYNGVATVSAGQPAEYATVDLTGQTAAISATTIYAVPAAGAGMYRISWVATITTAATTSSVLGGANGFQVVYTDPADSVVKTSVAGNSITSIANTTATSISGSLIAFCKLSTNLQYSFGYTSVGGTPMAYNLHVKVEAL